MMQDVWEVCFCRPVLRRSIIVAIVVGTIINLINQGDALFTDTNIHWPKIALTYLVPFCVASYGAYTGMKTAR
jgi:hypothetical protein